MDLAEVSFEDGRWMGLTLDRVQWLAFVPTALNFLVLLSELVI
jgi:hypothetical protein